MASSAEPDKQPRNIYGEPLQPCRPRRGGTRDNRDNRGSWDAESGACHADGIHSVCVSSLPSDFCRHTGQGDGASAWCARRRGQPHCICQGAFAMYAALAARGSGKKKQALPLKCGAIHHDVLEDLGRQAAHWRAGFGGNVLPALRALDGRCAAGKTGKERALRTRICDMYAKDRDPQILAKEDAWYRDTCTPKRRCVWPWCR